MPRQSAALLLYRLTEENVLEVLIAHMGGPFWAKKDARAWSIPKGEYEDHEEPLDAAKREFEEEMGSAPPQGDIIDLGRYRQPSGKVITTYAIRGDFDLAGFHSNTFTMEWPRKSGQLSEFPEVDKAEWMPVSRAADMLVKGQIPILDCLLDALASNDLHPVDAVKPSTDDDQETLF
jgi:predicted NUDIX family NTP pyrophosphohydrolase